MNLKQLAANRALEAVQNGMVIGLGTGSTTAFFTDLLGESLKSGKLAEIQVVPTSQDTERRATNWGIPMTTLFEHPHLALAVDGADEVDPQLNMIKGLGKAALREKIVESHTDHFIVIVDESKLVSQLGRGPLPVEITQYEAKTHIRWLASLGCRAELWCDEGGTPFITDNGNYLVRCWFENGIADAYALDRTLNDQPGVVGHGLFLGMAEQIIVAGADGIRVIQRP